MFPSHQSQRTHIHLLTVLQSGEALPQYVLHHPASVWLVGPFFAALTGLAFKEVSPMLNQHCLLKAEEV